MSSNLLEAKKDNKNLQEIYFDSFCHLIDDIHVLDIYSAFSIQLKFEEYLKEIKSETLLEFQDKSVDKNQLLEYKINEITKRSYDKNADIAIIQKWLTEYNLEINKIFDKTFQSNPISDLLISPYKDFERSDTDRKKAYDLQLDFYQFFCKYYVDELITFFNSKLDYSKNNPSITHDMNTKPFKETYLKAFIEENCNEREIYQSTFIQCYEFGIKNHTQSLKEEIKGNLLLLPNEKNSLYIDFVIDKIKNYTFYNKNPNIIEHWIKKYDLQGLTFPFIENEEVKRLISMSLNYPHLNDHDALIMEEIQLDFFMHASMLESKKIVEYLESIKTNSSLISIHDPIFLSEDAYKLFINIVNLLGINLVDIKHRGNQAKFSAIWSSPQSGSQVFNKSLGLKVYIDFINKNYNTNYNNKSLSQGESHHQKIKIYLQNR